MLMGSLRGLGLLRPRLGLQHEPAGDAYAAEAGDDAAALHATWTAWVAGERDVRIAWASFEYDCSLCTLTNRRGAVDLGELPSTLPCADALWEAQSAGAWAALRSRWPGRARGPALPSVLGAAMAGRAPAEHASMWAKRLCTQVIGRLLWDLKQLETLSKAEYCGLPSLFGSHQQSKTSLLRGLDSLLGLMRDPVSTSDLVSYKYG